MVYMDTNVQVPHFWCSYHVLLRGRNPHPHDIIRGAELLR